MSLKKQLQEKNDFLKKAYEVAYKYAPSSPLSVSINPIEFGESIGYNETDTTRIMYELVEDEFVTSSLGMGMLMVTNRGLNYLRKLEEEPQKTAAINLNVGNNSTVQFQHGTINSNQTIMKQFEKLDLILKELYNLKDSMRKYASITEICKKLNIPMSSDEWNRLSHRLENDGFVKARFMRNDCILELTTYGIDYCEQNSYTYSGHPVITNNYNVSIVNSPNSNLVNESSNVSITQNSVVQETIKNIRETAQQDKTVDPVVLQEILECLSEIEQGIKGTHKPKKAFHWLLETSGHIASITSLVLTLGQSAGLI